MGTLKHLRNDTTCDYLSCLIFVIFCIISRRMAIVTRLFDQKRPLESFCYSFVVVMISSSHCQSITVSPGREGNSSNGKHTFVSN